MTKTKCTFVIQRERERERERERDREREGEGVREGDCGKSREMLPPWSGGSSKDPK